MAEDVFGWYFMLRISERKHVDALIRSLVRAAHMLPWEAAKFVYQVRMDNDSKRASYKVV